VSYERRVYAFRFDTSEEMDDAFIAKMNNSANRSHFHLLFNNCADFSRVVLNFYFPGTFRRSIFPDVGMTTPKQVAYKLDRYSSHHPEMQLRVFAIPQVPGNRRASRPNKGISESLSTTAYAIPIALMNPYVAGGLFVNYLLHGGPHAIPKNPQLLEPENLKALRQPAEPVKNPLSASVQVHNDAIGDSARLPHVKTADLDLNNIPAAQDPAARE
jgi:hypothetical protein